MRTLFGPGPETRQLKLAHALGKAHLMTRQAIKQHAPSKTFFHRLDREGRLHNALLAEQRHGRSK